MKIVAILLLVSLSGCALNKVDHPEAVQDVVTPAKLETAKAEIVTSNNNTANALTGLITTSISKVAETVKGVEATLGQMVGDVSVKLADKFTGVDAKFEALLKVNTDLKLKLDAQIELNTVLQTKVDKLSANLDAQVGMFNKIENRLENINAGRDVNYLPKEAVDVIVKTNWLCYGIVTAILSLASTIIAMSYRASRQRAELRVKEEREERQAYFELLKGKL